MLLSYQDGPVNRLRIDFSDIPTLKGIGPVKMIHDRLTNEKLILSAALPLLPLDKKYVVLTYQADKVWLTEDNK